MKEVTNKELNEIQLLKNYALKAKEQIQISNNLHKIIDLYSNYIKKIKNILFDKNSIEENLKNIVQNLKNNIEKLQNDNQKLKNKYDIFYKQCTDELEMDRPNLNQSKDDNFILEYSLKQRDFIIQKLKNSIKNAKIYNVFRESKRETYTEISELNSVIKNISEESQFNLILRAKKYNILKEKMKKKRLKMNKLKEKINKLNELINIMKIDSKMINQNKQILNSENKTLDNTPSTNMEVLSKTEKISENQIISKNNEKFLLFENPKKYEEDSANNDENRYSKKNSKKIKNAILSTKIPVSFGSIKTMSVNPMLDDAFSKNEIYIDNSNINKFENKKNIFKKNNNLNKALSEENRKSKKIKNKKNKIIQSFLNLEDLFEITDSENEDEEVLIDTILHSDDETILENKINSKKTISKTYKEQIEKNLPKINLSLIEYNKLKAYQEVDLYSLQRRDYKGHDIEDNIKWISKKMKKLKLKENLNNKKVKIMKKYIDDLKNKYKLYKKIIIKSTANDSKVKYISNNEIIDINTIENGDESGNEIGSDYLNEDDEISENNE
jgi:hypothetical protein